jgi:asparagine synthase (glutamine-hydrolysing)
MSGICGLFNLDGAPVSEAEIQAMTAMLEARGPEGTGKWRDVPVGLGHTLLATTPELIFERQPHVHAETGCVITADVRLDNRQELIGTLFPARQQGSIGDAELILAAYLRWGEKCPQQLLGDFAFVVWDPRMQRLFCGRDHLGMRPLYYHHAAGQRFAFASDARAILVLPQVPYRVNKGRIADFLVPELEWYDYTSSFFEQVHRLPPGHRAIVTRSGIDIAEYWQPRPGADPGSMTDDDYRQGFLEVFTAAVDARLRAPQGKVGSMLSGGIDSGSVVAVAKGLLAERGEGPLATFSAARRPDSSDAEGIDCPETRAIHAALSMPSISAKLVLPDTLEDLLPELSSGHEEPFDGVLDMLKAIFLRAHEHGHRTLLDGGGGDVLLHEGSYIVRLIRQGNLKLAVEEIRGESDYWNERSAAPRLMRYVRSAVLPDFVKRPARAIRNRHRFEKWSRDSLISPEFAREIGIADRYRQMMSHFPSGWIPDYPLERCLGIRPNLTAGRERYARIAAAAGMEARDPFMDKRVVEFCARLPGRFRLRHGWPKPILRDITAGILPDEVLWTRRKPHLGWWFSDAVTRLAQSRGGLDMETLLEELEGYVDPAALKSRWETFCGGGDSEPIHRAFILAGWLREAARRPVTPSAR